MTVVYLAGATCLAGALTFVFAFLTWRRVLARRALIVGLAGLLLFVALSYQNRTIPYPGLTGPMATFWQR
jgi:asparagine N-glycosylation enzyme membrane subunit Stt3